MHFTSIRYNPASSRIIAKVSPRMSAPADWYTEHFEISGSSIGFRVTRKLDEVQSPFQKIEIYETTDWGNLMVIDGAMMLTTRDNFLYHEMMSHPVLFTHSQPEARGHHRRRRLRHLREVLKHKEVESRVQCDIDEQVTRMAEKYFPELCESNADPRAELLFDDGIAYMRTATRQIDVVIVDSTDPVGPAEGLFNEAFFACCARCGRRHPGAAERIAAGAARPDQGNAGGDGQGRLRQFAHPAVPAALLPHRLVELHDGAQERGCPCPAKREGSGSALPRSRPGRTSARCHRSGGCIARFESGPDPALAVDSFRSES
jgi:hypothetical protein